MGVKLSRRTEHKATEYSFEARSLSQHFIARLVSLCPYFDFVKNNLGLSSQTILGLSDFRRLQKKKKKTEPSSPSFQGNKLTNILFPVTVLRLSSVGSDVELRTHRNIQLNQTKKQ